MWVANKARAFVGVVVLALFQSGSAAADPASCLDAGDADVDLSACDAGDAGDDAATGDDAAPPGDDAADAASPDEDAGADAGDDSGPVVRGEDGNQCSLGVGHKTLFAGGMMLAALSLLIVRRRRDD